MAFQPRPSIIVRWPQQSTWHYRTSLPRMSGSARSRLSCATGRCDDLRGGKAMIAPYLDAPNGQERAEEEQAEERRLARGPHRGEQAAPALAGIDLTAHPAPAAPEPGLAGQRRPPLVKGAPV